MSFRNGSWARRTPSVDLFDHSHEYHSTVVPRRHINGTTIFCAIVLIVWGISIICKH